AAGDAPGRGGAVHHFRRPGPVVRRGAGVRHAVPVPGRPDLQGRQLRVLLRGRPRVLVPGPGAADPLPAPADGVLAGGDGVAGGRGRPPRDPATGPARRDHRDGRVPPPRVRLLPVRQRVVVAVLLGDPCVRAGRGGGQPAPPGTDRLDRPGRARGLGGD